MSLIYSGDDYRGRGSGGEYQGSDELPAGFGNDFAYPPSAQTQIIERDPVHGEFEPTLRQIEQHRDWAIATFGEKAWRLYRADREPGQ